MTKCKRIDSDSFCHVVLEKTFRSWHKMYPLKDLILKSNKTPRYMQ